MKDLFISFLLLVCTAPVAFSQTGHGGYPLDIYKEKSSVSEADKIVMPAFDLEKDMAGADEMDSLFKSLKFAHSFSVSLTPENSGTWYVVGMYNVWQLVIESQDALSLNLVFQKYHLPEGARLYLFDSEKEYIRGAFTLENNSASGKFAVYPIPGDQIVVQYEEPIHASFKGELEISEVNHDFKGAFDALNRWSRRESGECNVNVNCETASGLDKQKRSVVRIFAGDELGTGTLVNNLNNDGTPYVISALHVFDDASGAETAFFDFNYESPFCTDLEGDDIQSITGATAVAVFDSLDMMMVKLSSVPPASYRPYWAGWDARTVAPSNSYCIHHPNGDTKKISHDTGACDSVRYSSKYINYNNWKVLNWETGTTESGSSGAGLFDSNGRFVGVLLGGVASCSNLSYDLFTRFDKLFDYKSENSKQYKHWLDPENTGASVCDGVDYYENQDCSCLFASNFVVDDTMLVLNNGEGNYYTGNNSMGITEVAEKFTTVSSGYLTGIAVGVSTLVNQSSSATFGVRVYSGTNVPETLEKEFTFSYGDLLANSMNYLSFSSSVEISGTFFISFVLSDDSDTITFYQSAQRSVAYDNTIFYLKSGIWKSTADLTGKSTANAALLVEALVCSADVLQVSDSSFQSKFVKFYPIPATTEIEAEFNERLEYCKFKISDMLGRIVYSTEIENRTYTSLDVSALIPGLYILTADNGSEIQTQKIMIISE